jgi:hypothetical protein
VTGTNGFAIVAANILARNYLVTGGAGFIGSAVVRRLIETTDHRVLVIDKLTYAGNLESLAPVSSNPRYQFDGWTSWIPMRCVVSFLTFRQMW